MSIAKTRWVSAVIPRGVTADTLVLLLHNLRLIDDRRWLFFIRQNPERD